MCFFSVWEIISAQKLPRCDVFCGTSFKMSETTQEIVSAVEARNHELLKQLMDEKFDPKGKPAGHVVTPFLMPLFAAVRRGYPGNSLCSL